jgi:class 3 adenylate cyclase
MGDAGLVVCPTESVEQVVFALADLAREARESALRFGLDVYLNVSVHVGPALVGSFGAPGEERFDVIGKTVNIAARLGRRGIRLSQQAYRCLSPEGRERFQKIARPTTYHLRS